MAYHLPGICKMILSAALFALPAMLFAQNDADSTAAYFNPNTGQASEHFGKMSRRKASYQVNMEGYVGGRKNNTAWGFNTSAQVTAPVSKKVDVTAGISVMQSYYNGADFIPWSVITDGRPSKRFNTTDAIAYAAIAYYVNSRLTLYASGFINMADSGNPFIPKKGFSVGADYRLSDRAMLSFNCSYIEGGMPYGYGYYGYPGIGSSMYGSMHNPWNRPGYWM